MSFLKWLFLLACMAMFAFACHSAIYYEVGWTILQGSMCVCLLWCAFWAQVEESRKARHITREPFPFGYRRISPDGERWEWWNGQQWKDCRMFVLHLNVHHEPGMTLNDTFNKYQIIYQLTYEKPFKPCKHFHETDSWHGAE